MHINNFISDFLGSFRELVLILGVLSELLEGDLRQYSESNLRAVRMDPRVAGRGVRGRELVSVTVVA